MRLANKVALITGGATGIGRAITLRFAQEGAAVVVADINEEQGKATAAEASGLFVLCDTAQPAQAQAAVEQTVLTYGGLDILVNSAAHLGGYHDVATMPEDEWRAVMSVTLDGVYHTSKYAVPKMIERGAGSIIHICLGRGHDRRGRSCRLCYRQKRHFWLDPHDGD